MNFYEQRLKDIADMFLQTINHIEQSRTLTDVKDPDLAKYRVQYIAQVIKQSLNNEKQQTINNLIKRLEAYQNNNTQAQIEQLKKNHEIELANLRRDYEEVLAKNMKSKNSVEIQVKKLIEDRMKQIENDYILKVIHQQEIKKLTRKLTKSKPENQELVQLRTCIQQLTKENQLLKQQIVRWKAQESRYHSNKIQDKSFFIKNEIQEINIKQHDYRVDDKQNLHSPNSSSNHISKNQDNQSRNSQEKIGQLKNTFQQELQQLRETLKQKHLKLMKDKSKNDEYKRHDYPHRIKQLRCQIDNQKVLESTHQNGYAQIINKPNVYHSSYRSPRHNVSQRNTVKDHEEQAKVDIKSPKQYIQYSNQRILNKKRREQQITQSEKKAIIEEPTQYTFKYLNIKI